MTTPRDATLPTHLTALAILGTALVLLAASLSGYWSYTVDDAFISFRYAAHWAAGEGLSWNPGGQPQEGYTSILHVALLAGLSTLGAPLEVSSKLLGVAALGVAIVLAAVLAHRLARVTLLITLATVTVGTVALAHLFPVHAVAGLETTLFAALWLALAVATDDEPLSPRRAQVVAVLSLALGLCRPEGNLVAGVTWATLLLTTRAGERRRLALTVLGLYLLPAATYFAWRWQRYGLPMPLPFYVKVSTASGPQGLAVAGGFLRSIPWVVGLLAALGAGLTVAGHPRWRASRLLLPVLAFGVFFLWPDHLMGFDFRFYSPTVPFVLALAAVGLAQAGRAGRFAMPLALVVFAGWQLPWRSPAAQRWWAAQRFESYAQGLDAAHRRVGAALAAARPGWSHPSPLLAIGDCGVVPYSSDWRTLDTFGLNDSALARLRPPRDLGYTQRVFAEKPDVLVLLSSDASAFTALPVLPWEGLLYEQALARGYLRLGTAAFSPNYHLWLLAPAGEAGAPGLARQLESAGPGQQ